MRYSLTARLARLWKNEEGWITAALAGAGLLGNLFGKQAEGSAKGRAAEANLLMQQDLLRNQQYGTAQNAQMNAGQLDLQRKNFSPTRVSVPGIQNAQVSGGLQVGAGAKASLAELYKQALAAQMAGDTFEGGQILNAPQLSQLPQRSGWEKAAGILGTLGTLAGGVGSMLPQSSPNTPSSMPNILNMPNVRF